MENKNGEVKNALFIFNPVSGGGSNEDKRKLIEEKASELGWQGEFIETTKNRGGAVIAKEYIEKGITHIIICGGDGSVREILKVLVGKDISLGIIPIGTGNIYAKNLGLPLDLNEAALVALHGRKRKVDAGVANGHFFSLVAGVGTSVDTMGKTSPTMKSKMGISAYIWTVLGQLSKPGKRYKIILDGKESKIYRASSIIVANIGKTAGGIDFAPGANATSGDLHVAVLKVRSLGALLHLVFNALRGNLYKNRNYHIMDAINVVLYPLDGPTAYECDGDVFPPTDKLEISILPKAVTVLVPDTDMAEKIVRAKTKTVVFDFDGTLVDTLEILVSIYNSLAEKHGYTKVLAEEIQRLRGKSAREVLAELKIEKKRVSMLSLEGTAQFKDNLNKVELFPGIKEVLLKLKTTYGLGIVTKNDADLVKTLLEKNDLNVFDFIDSDHSIFGKGRVLKKMLTKYNFDKGDVFYVGDEIRDIVAAREAGIKMISVTWGFNSKVALKEYKPDYLVDTPGELLQMLY